MNPLWIASRATGLVSFVLLTLVVVLGIAVHRQAGSPRTPRFVVTGLHRNATLIAVVLVAVHVVSVVVDSYVSVSWLDAILPFLGSYQPFWLGLGTVSLDLMALLTVTSLLRHRLPVRLWRGIHWLAYLFWPVALVHAVGMGTDLRTVPGLAVVAACGLVVVGAGLWRMGAPPVGEPHTRAEALLHTLYGRRSTDARVRAIAGR
ncbi:MAG: ferric reductase-like transmembrane domain-containing protein [Cellulomonas sp.]